MSFKSLRKEFKDFVMRGNAVDMAIGVIIGGAFSGIVNSLVNDIIMPIIGFLVSGIDFSNLRIVLKEATPDAPAVTINWGMLINSIIHFLIIALCLFAMVKSLNKVSDSFLKHEKEKKKEEDKPAEPAEPTEKELLNDILTELKKQNSNV